MAITDLTAETLEATIERGIVLVDLWATWTPTHGRARLRFRQGATRPEAG